MGKGRLCASDAYIPGTTRPVTVNGGKDAPGPARWHSFPEPSLHGYQLGGLCQGRGSDPIRPCGHGRDPCVLSGSLPLSCDLCRTQRQKSELERDRKGEVRASQAGSSRTQYASGSGRSICGDTQRPAACAKNGGGGTRGSLSAATTQEEHQCLSTTGESLPVASRRKAL